MDDYETDLQLDDHNEVDVWAGEDEVSAAGMPEALWCDAGVKHHPPEPDSWVYRLADEVELQRLCSMGVLARAGEEAQLVTDKLTIKFVYDWRLKTFVNANGVERKRWLRRSRLGPSCQRVCIRGKTLRHIQSCNFHSYPQPTSSDVFAKGW
jgi:hypothetical protein